MNANKKIQLTTDDEKNLKRIKKLLLQSLTEHHSLATLSSYAGVNRFKLTYGFKQITGYSVHQFIIKTRMESAKKLLQKTDKPIKEIARLTGYDTSQNFVTAFKNYYSISPSYQRKQKERK